MVGKLLMALLLTFSMVSMELEPMRESVQNIVTDTAVLAASSVIPVKEVVQAWDQERIEAALRHITTWKTSDEAYQDYKVWILKCPQNVRDKAVGTCTKLLYQEYRRKRLGVEPNYTLRIGTVVGIALCAYVGFELWFAYQQIEDDVPLNQVPSVVAIRALNNITMQPQEIISYTKALLRKNHE